MTETQRIAFLQALFAKNKLVWDIAGDMMAKPDADDNDDDQNDSDDDDDSDEDDDQDDSDDDESEDEDEDDGDFTDEELDAMADEISEGEDDEDEPLGEGGKKTLTKLRQMLIDNGIDPQTGKPKVKAKDVPGAAPKGADQTKEARVALKRLAAEVGFYEPSSITKHIDVADVKFDADGDLVPSSVKALLSELREKHSRLFDEDDSDETTQTTRKVPGKPKEKRGGPRNTNKSSAPSASLRTIEAKIRAKKVLSESEVAKLAATETDTAEKLYDLAADAGLLSGVVGGR